MSVDSVLSEINRRVLSAVSRRPLEFQSICLPKVIAVSKTKPISLIIEAYRAGQRQFGENYVKELLEKSTSSEIRENCPNILWHFIGNLQRSNVNKLLIVENLAVIQTINSIALADTVNNRWKRDRKIEVMIQVNTSGEKSKTGVTPADVELLANHIEMNCSQLHMIGLMTIGSVSEGVDKGENSDFTSLVNCRRQLCRSRGTAETSLQLSMGMSGDFEQAILQGSDVVRIGSLIFGARSYSGKQ